MNKSVNKTEILHLSGARVDLHPGNMCKHRDNYVNADVKPSVFFMLFNILALCIRNRKLKLLSGGQILLVPPQKL